MTIPSFLLHVCLYTIVAVWIIVCKFFAHKKTFEYKITWCQWVQIFLPWQIWGFLLGIIMSHVYRQQIKLGLNCTVHRSQITAYLQLCDFSLSQYWEFLILCGNNFRIYKQIWYEHLSEVYILLYIRSQDFGQFSASNKMTVLTFWSRKWHEHWWSWVTFEI